MGARESEAAHAGALVKVTSAVCIGRQALATLLARLAHRGHARRQLAHCKQFCPSHSQQLYTRMPAASSLHDSSALPSPHSYVRTCGGRATGW